MDVGFFLSKEAKTIIYIGSLNAKDLRKIFLRYLEHNV